MMRAVLVCVLAAWLLAPEDVERWWRARTDEEKTGVVLFALVAVAWGDD